MPELIRWSSAITTALVFASCGNPSIVPTTPLPELSPLPTESVIAGSDSFVVSGVVSSPTCDLLLSDGRHGGIARVRADGTVGSIVFPLGREVRGLRIEPFGNDTSLVWSRAERLLGFLDHEALGIHPIPVPVPEWDSAVLGSVAGVSGRLIGIAALSDGLPVRQPEPWSPSHLVRLIDEQGDVRSSLGVVEEVPGRYLSWLLGRSVIGAVNDGVGVLFLSKGHVTVFQLAANDDVTIRRYVLPNSIDSPDPREEVWDPHWIQIGGEMPHFIEVPQILAGDFRPNGGVVAVRPYSAKWRRVRNRFVPTQGTWEVEKRGLEVYSPDGDRLAAFRLPSPSVDWIQVDRHDRLFVANGTGLVHVARIAPAFDETQCPLLPREVHLATAAAAALTS